MKEQLVMRVTALVFTALYAVAMFVPTLPEGAYSDADVLALVNDSGSRTAIVLGGWALTFAGVVFLVWLAAMSSRLVDPGAWPARLVLAAGVGYGLFVMLAATAFSGLAFGIAVGEVPEPGDAYLIRVLSQLGFHLVLLPALLCASLLVAAVTELGRRHGSLPTPVLVIGAVVAPLLWAGPLWAPQFLVPVWMIAVSMTLRAPTPTPAPAPGHQVSVSAMSSRSEPPLTK